MPRLIDKIGYWRPPKDTYNEQGLIIQKINHPELEVDIYLSIHEPPKSLEKENITFIYSHGNAENIPLSQLWMDDCCRIFRSRFVCYDYLGYGETQGAASEPTTLKIIELVYEYIKETYPEDKLIIWGRSIGTVPSVYIASKHPGEIQALIVESGMASGLKVICTNPCFINCMGCANGFFNERRIVDVTCPVLVVHGTDDKTIPFRNSVDIMLEYRKKRCPGLKLKVIFDEEGGHQLSKLDRLWHFGVNEGGHNDIDTTFERVLVDMIISFYRYFYGEGEMHDCKPENKRHRIPRGDKTGQSQRDVI